MTKANHERAAAAHDEAAGFGASSSEKANEATARAYGATWDATGGKHPKTIDLYLANTGDTKEARLAHEALRDWHRLMAR